MARKGHGGGQPHRLAHDNVRKRKRFPLEATGEAVFEGNWAEDCGQTPSEVE